MRVFCDASQQKQGSKFYFSLNGEALDALENDSMLIAYTKIYNNLITVSIDDENRIRDSYRFTAPSGGSIDVHFLGDMFQPGLTEITYAEKPSYTPSGKDKTDW